VLTAIVIVALLCFATLRAAERLHRVIGPTGMIALTRLTGFLMVCIGVQFIIDGLTANLRDPEFWSGLSQAVATD
jgi:multiple antibiotic resistance protein